jgi:predicted Fe-S protein YdhL (DUF1289 family)
MTLQQDNKLLHVQQVVAKSKCVNKCKLDPYREYCLGCNRSMEEIINCGKQIRKTT